jgi:hypothetical protein
VLLREEGHPHNKPAFNCGLGNYHQALPPAKPDSASVLPAWDKLSHIQWRYLSLFPRSQINLAATQWMLGSISRDKPDY